MMMMMMMMMTVGDDDVDVSGLCCVRAVPSLIRILFESHLIGSCWVKNVKVLPGARDRIHENCACPRSSSACLVFLDKTFLQHECCYPLSILYLYIYVVQSGVPWLHSRWCRSSLSTMVFCAFDKFFSLSSHVFTSFCRVQV